MNKITLWFSVTVVLVFAPAAQAAAIVIDFENLRVDDELIHYVGPVYAVDGFIFTASVPGGGDVPRFGTNGTLNPSFMGSTPLFNQIGSGGTTLTRSDGGLFHLFSIDLAEMPNFDEFGNPIDMGSFSLTFIGIRANGQTVRATATIHPFPNVTIFKFNGFTNLVSVQWFQGGGGAQGLTHQFDNVRVQAVQGN